MGDIELTYDAGMTNEYENRSSKNDSLSDYRRSG